VTADSPAGGPAAVIVLAAGEGTRMRSRTTPKVLHAFGGRTMLGHVLAATAALGPRETVVVVGHAREAVAAHVSAVAPAARAVVQAEQNGTGHAVRVALDELPDLDGTVVVVPGDAPLLTPETLTALVATHRRLSAATTLLTAELDDPTGYGRVIRAGGGVSAVVEHRDATAVEREVREVATSVYAFDAARLRESLHSLSTGNAAGEEYLTDVVGLHVHAGHVVAALVAEDADETLGVNDRAQLAVARAVLRDRLVRGHLLAGVTVVDPATTWLDADVQIEPDAVIHPGCQLLGATRVAAGAEVGPECTLVDTVVGEGAVVRRATCESAEVGPGAVVGPYTYLRPGTRLGPGSKAGGFVEMKAAELAEGAKVPHLSYVGDAQIGPRSNIGAATVFVNYDGRDKHRTVVGADVRIGSDTMLVAPVEVGDGAYTAAGSVITGDVPPGALGVARARQRNIEGWAARRRGSPEPDPTGPGDATRAEGDTP
jgi:bifunctional UDP-N-acetylglucosamine pyrophosphorylase / glucosamine-1-phosphate N-acetyltransferase